MCFSQIALCRVCDGCKRGIIHVLEMYVRHASCRCHTVSKDVWFARIILVHSSVTHVIDKDTYERSRLSARDIFRHC